MARNDKMQSLLHEIISFLHKSADIGGVHG